MTQLILTLVSCSTCFVKRLVVRSFWSGFWTMNMGIVMGVLTIGYVPTGLKLLVDSAATRLGTSINVLTARAAIMATIRCFRILFVPFRLSQRHEHYVASWAHDIGATMRGLLASERRSLITTDP